MGFVDSFVAWLIVVLIIAFLLFAAFSYILGWFYPREEQIVVEETHEESEELDENQRQAQSRRRLIWVFAITAIIAIMATSGYNAFANTKS